MIAEGHTMKSIASLLVISPKTVEGHMAESCEGCAKNRADLGRYAIGAGLVRFEAVRVAQGWSEFAVSGASGDDFGGANEYHRLLIDIC